MVKSTLLLWCHKAHNKHLVVYHENAVLMHFAVKCGRLRSWRYYQIFHHHASRQIKCENQFSKPKPLKCHNGFWVLKLEIAALSEMPCAAPLTFIRRQQKGHLEQSGWFCLCLFSSSISVWQSMKFVVLTITAPLDLSFLPTVFVEFWIQRNDHLDDGSWPKPDDRNAPKESAYVTRKHKHSRSGQWEIWWCQNIILNMLYVQTRQTGRKKPSKP